MRYGPTSALCLLTSLSACGSDAEIVLESRLDQTATLQVLAPRDNVPGACSVPFATRYCADAYEPVGTVTVLPGGRRTIALSDDGDDDFCLGVFWLRMAFIELDGTTLGPIEDAGTLIEAPTTVELEQGAGAVHQAAFAGITVRIDEVGSEDAHQAPPPPACDP